jgi:tetratricopeptide (TPR) repeat protein
MQTIVVVALSFLLMLYGLNMSLGAEAGDLQSLGVGHVHMDMSCSPAVSRNFDIALALLHNFWYPRALSTFDRVIRADPECAMAYWGAAMTYNHPFWDAPTQTDEQSAWTLVQKGMKAKKKSPREAMYIDAVAALYREGGAGKKSDRDKAYMNAMAALYTRYPDDDTKLFYALSILGTIEEGSQWSGQQELAARMIEQVYADDPHNPGALHYMIHAYDDPVHAAQGLKAARAYADAAPAVPHALHMPSHIFTRLGYWEESAATNEKAWRVSESDVSRSGELGGYRDFHSLNYLLYAYIQLGRYEDAKRLTGIFAAQYAALPDKTTHPDTPNLEVRHVRGRTIYALPDRVVYGYFDTLARYIMESGEWQLASNLPSAPSSRDFAAMRLQIKAMAAAKQKDAASARAAADRIVILSNEAGQRPLAQKVLTIQAKEAQAEAALASGDSEKATANMNDAVRIEDSIYALSQPPYPPIPVHELYGTMLLDMNRPAQAREQFAESLKRTPGRPKAIYGLAQSAQALGDNQTAAGEYAKFLQIWENADPSLPEITTARRFLASTQTGS